jgi:glycosyltransferase involved in cell wall biosynthesis
MKKVLIIKSAQESAWGSCKIISPNLQAAYEMLAAAGDVELRSFGFYDRNIVDGLLNGKDNVAELAELLQSWTPDLVSFVDHLPLPNRVLNHLSHYIAVRKLPPVLVHVYGDFTYFSDEWYKLTDQFKGHPIKFVVASAAQRRLVSFFLEEGHGPDYVKQYLFPVNEGDYYFDPAARAELRARHEVGPEERVVLYAGRVSLQKNVDLLIREFRHLSQASPAPLRLWIAGAFDDVGAVFMGAKNYEGFMFSKIQKLLSGFPEDVRSRITLLGQQDKASLRRLKSAADVFVSLSLYHDEDYGMSPAEALACGLPAVLTDWGGYGSFVGADWNCRLVPVAITEFGHQIGIGKLREHVLAAAGAATTAPDRERWARAFQEKFSITGSAARLREILAEDVEPFRGFKWNLNYLSSIFWKEDRRSKFHYEHVGQKINANFNPTSSSFYHDIYRNYISETPGAGTKHG